MQKVAEVAQMHPKGSLLCYLRAVAGVCFSVSVNCCTFRLDDN